MSTQSDSTPQAQAFTPDELIVLGLFYAGAAVTNMFFYFTQTFLGDHPPPNIGYYLAFNLPWLIAPLALAARVLLGSDTQR